MLFAAAVIGEALPYYFSGGGFPVVVFAASRTADLSGENSFRALWYFSAPAIQSCLNKLKLITVDDRFVVVLNEVLRQLTAVYASLFRKMVFAENLLQPQISGVLFISENPPDLIDLPYAARPCGDAFLVESFADFLQSVSLCVKVKNVLDYGRFIRHKYDFSVNQSVTEHGAGGRSAFFKSLADTPFAVIAAGKALRLGEGGKQCQQDLAFCTEGINVLLLEINIDADACQFPDRLQKGHRVSGKAGYAFRDYHIHFAVIAVRQQLLKLFTVFLGARFCLIGIDPGKPPFRIAHYV